MAQNTTEFIFFNVKCDVEPEDPSSELGEGLLRVFRATQQQSGHYSSAWGRTKEDPNMIVWVVGALYNLCILLSTIVPNKKSIRLDGCPLLSNLVTVEALPCRREPAYNGCLCDSQPTHQQYRHFD